MVHARDRQGSAAHTELDAVLRVLLRSREEPGHLGQLARHHWQHIGPLEKARLALATSAACGLDARPAIGIAATCELLDNASVVHDDLQDQNRERDGRASLWQAYGIGPATNFGDYLLISACQEATRVDAGQGRFLELLIATSLQAVRGQGRDLDPYDACNARLGAWEANARRKAGALMALPVVGALTAANASDGMIAAAREAMEWAGAARQVVDDLLDICPQPGDRATRGRDLALGRPNAAVLHYRRLEGAKAREDFDDLVRRRANAEEISRTAAQIARSPAFNVTIDYFFELQSRSREARELLPRSLRSVIDEELDRLSRTIANMELAPMPSRVVVREAAFGQLVALRDVQASHSLREAG